MAMISAWAVGSLEEVTSFAPSAIIFPSFTTTAPNGPPRPERTFSIASAMARAMKGFATEEVYGGSRGGRERLRFVLWIVTNRFAVRRHLRLWAKILSSTEVSQFPNPR